MSAGGYSEANLRGMPNTDRWATFAGHEGAWVAVADGLGSRPRGAESAEVALRSVAASLARRWPDDDELVGILERASGEVLALGAGDDGGTTLTVGVLVDGVARVAWIGDSPAWLRRDGRLYEMTPCSVKRLGLDAWAGQHRPDIRVRSVRAGDDAVLVAGSDGAQLRPGQLGPRRPWDAVLREAIRASRRAGSRDDATLAYCSATS